MDKMTTAENNATGNLHKPLVIGSWVAVTDGLPDLTDKEYAYGHKVITCWGESKNNMAQMNYRTRTVRGEKINYFEWNGKIDPFGVKYWMEFPQPPNFL